MLKIRIVLLAALAFGISFSAFSNEAALSSPLSSVESAGMQQYACQVQTVCYSRFSRPYVVGCLTYGPGCSAYAQPGYSVQCSGYVQSPYGAQWVNYYQRCYY